MAARLREAVAFIMCIAIAIIELRGRCTRLAREQGTAGDVGIGDGALGALCDIHDDHASIACFFQHVHEILALRRISGSKGFQYNTLDWGCKKRTNNCRRDPREKSQRGYMHKGSQRRSRSLDSASLRRVAYQHWGTSLLRAMSVLN